MGPVLRRWTFAFTLSRLLQFQLQQTGESAGESLVLFYFLYTEHNKGNKTVQGKVVTTRTEDGHK